MANRNAMGSQKNGENSTKDEDFDEADVWGTMYDNDAKTSSHTMMRKSKKPSSSTTTTRVGAAPRMIPKASRDDHGHGHGRDDGHHDDDNDGDDDDDMLPPHEYIARRQARRQISSYSMQEGIGRTLKGRDLSKVRDAILRQTGFLEKR